MKQWQQICDKLFPPPEAKWLVWVMVPSCFLLISALVMLVQNSPFQAIALALALSLQVIYAVSGKKSLFLIGLCAFIATLSYLVLQEENFLWNIGWLATLFISLLVGYEMTGQAQTIFQLKETTQKELERDALLWKSRFETLREKIVNDKEVWEGEIDKLGQEIEAKKRDADSLRVLIKISHKETRKAEERIHELMQQPKVVQVQEESIEIDGKKLDKEEMLRILEELNELRCKQHETELQLEKANLELSAQQEALRQRQTINESLQTKKATKQPISLKDLAKKL